MYCRLIPSQLSDKKKEIRRLTWLIMVKRVLVGYGIDVDAVSGWYGASESLQHFGLALTDN